MDHDEPTPQEAVEHLPGVESYIDFVQARIDRDQEILRQLRSLRARYDKLIDHG